MKYKRIVKLWLLLGLFMLLVQILVGGITRLTGSGLSITKWEIVTGTLPPLSNSEWKEEFDLYKSTPQYDKINQGMILGSIFKPGSFKFIYFWEYIHRLWARLMGFVFLLPCLLFIGLKWVDPPLLKRLGIVILLAVLAASFGWIMVASGLINRPWVNAYKLSLHLCIGLSVYAMMLWTCFFAFKVKTKSSDLYRRSKSFSLILAFQIFLGGIMSGMKAGLFYPTWPDMNGDAIPSIIGKLNEYTMANFNNYESNILVPALIQFSHRSVAYILAIVGLIFIYKLFKQGQNLQRPATILLITLFAQILIGILTVVNCKGNIPVGYGVLHQGMAVLLISISLYLNYILKKR